MEISNRHLVRIAFKNDLAQQLLYRTCQGDPIHTIFYRDFHKGNFQNLTWYPVSLLCVPSNTVWGLLPESNTGWRSLYTFDASQTKTLHMYCTFLMSIHSNKTYINWQTQADGVMAILCLMWISDSTFDTRICETAPDKGSIKFPKSTHAANVSMQCIVTRNSLPYSPAYNSELHSLKKQTFAIDNYG